MPPSSTYSSSASSSPPPAHHDDDEEVKEKFEKDIKQCAYCPGRLVVITLTPWPSSLPDLDRPSIPYLLLRMASLTHLALASMGSHP